MNTRPKFWKRPPSPYWRDLRVWALLLPALAATLGGTGWHPYQLPILRESAPWWLQ